MTNINTPLQRFMYGWRKGTRNAVLTNTEKFNDDIARGWEVGRAAEEKAWSQAQHHYQHGVELGQALLEGAEKAVNQGSET